LHDADSALQGCFRFDISVHMATGQANQTHQEHEGTLSFATDAWTSPNHKAYVAVTVHFEKEGEPVSMLLDMVQVAESHAGLTLAAVFAKILEDFGISDKVSVL
jgi:hypothetical protein